MALSQKRWSIKVVEFGAQDLVNLRQKGIFETLAVGKEKKKLAFPYLLLRLILIGKDLFDSFLDHLSYLPLLRL